MRVPDEGTGSSAQLHSPISPTIPLSLTLPRGGGNQTAASPEGGGNQTAAPPTPYRNTPGRFFTRTESCSQWASSFSG
jgi:hypothetical protein